MIIKNDFEAGVQRVQKVQRVQRVVVGGCAASINKTFKTGLSPVGKEENRTTALRAMEMHPYPRLRRYFPRWGKSALCFSLVLT